MMKFWDCGDILSNDEILGLYRYLCQRMELLGLWKYLCQMKQILLGLSVSPAWTFTWRGMCSLTYLPQISTIAAGALQPQRSAVTCCTKQPVEGGWGVGGTTQPLMGCVGDCKSARWQRSGQDVIWFFSKSSVIQNLRNISRNTWKYILNVEILCLCNRI
jgi:hypothetical protein